MRVHRKIVKIDEAKCDGCGLCVPSCAEGAIQIIDGKARLISETYCDGLGACLGECPQDAITIEDREAQAYDEPAVERHLAAHGKALHKPEPDAASAPACPTASPVHAGCPGAKLQNLDRPQSSAAPQPSTPRESALSHWPVKLNLVTPGAPFLDGADLMLAADCVPVATAEFHRSLLPGHAVVIGCPKFDAQPQESLARLTAILRDSNVRSLTVVHMEVPCCFGYWQLGQTAWRAAGAAVPLRQVVISLQGDIKQDQTTEPVAAAS